MSFDITPLLLHSDDVPREAKLALEAASHLARDQRVPLLQDAARTLYRLTPLACGEARELVGLPPGTC